MIKPKNEDLDDGFDEDSLLEDEEFRFERAHKRRENRSTTKSPRAPRDGNASRQPDKPTRHP